MRIRPQNSVWGWRGSRLAIEKFHHGATLVLPRVELKPMLGCGGGSLRKIPFPSYRRRPTPGAGIETLSVFKLHGGVVASCWDGWTPRNFGVPLNRVISSQKNGKLLLYPRVWCSTLASCCP